MIFFKLFWTLLCFTGAYLAWSNLRHGILTRFGYDPRMTNITILRQRNALLIPVLAALIIIFFGFLPWSC